MAEFYVWVTTRRIKEGTLDDLRHAWEPPEPPEARLRVGQRRRPDSRRRLALDR